MVVSGRAVVVVVWLLMSVQYAAAQASAPARQVRIDRLVMGTGRAIDVSATDSNVVIVTVTGGKYPLVAESTAEAARRWVMRTDSISRSGLSSSHMHASERNEFGYNSDILRHQKLTSEHGPRDVVAIDIGPNNLTIYSADVQPSVLGRLTEAMLRAARATDSLTPPAKRCIIESGMAPIAYSGPNGYAPGINLDKMIQPPLRAGSPMPTYPPSADGARVIGNVTARFVIDTAGRPAVETFRLSGPANSLFVKSVCDALPSMRFVPVAVNGRPIAQLVERTFIISPPALRR